MRALVLLAALAACDSDSSSTLDAAGSGSDAANGKVTFATLYGPEKAMETARRINADNCRRMNEIFGERADFLTELAKSLLTRKN